VTSAIPTGGALQAGGNIPSGQTAGGGTVANPTWLPPFKIGQGLTGVFTDARGLIAGEVATATGQAASSSSSSSSSTPGSDEPAGAASGAASTIPSGGATPKATSQAQRNANNAAATAENPGYVGAG